MAEKKYKEMPFPGTDGDLAYDLDYAARKYRLEHAGEDIPTPEKEPYIRPSHKAQTTVRPEKKTKAASLPSPAMVLSCTAVLIVLMMTVFGYISLDRVSREIVSLKASVSELKQENIDLTTKHELTFELSGVKAAAEAAGMAKPSSSQVYYLDLASEDQVSVFTPEKSPLSSLKASAETLLGNVKEYFR